MKKIIRKIKTILRENKELKKVIKNQNKVAQYLNENYIQAFFQGEFKNELNAKKHFEDEKIIWQYWAQGDDSNMPEIVRACFESVDKNCDDYKIIRLNDENISEYLDFPCFVMEKLKNNDEFTYAFFSDLLRVALLALYGGVWIDATIYLSGKIEKRILEQDFFAYQRTLKKPNDYKLWVKYNRDYFCWDKNYRVKLLSSFMISKKNNLIFRTLLDILLEYWKKENTLRHYFLLHLIFDELMQYEEYSNLNTYSKSDLLPHVAQLGIQEKYNKELWDKMCLLSSIHKLTYFPTVQKESILEHILKTSVILNNH